MFFAHRVCAVVAVVVALVLVGPGLARADGKRVGHPRSHVHVGKVAVHRSCHPISSYLLKGRTLCFASARMRAAALGAGWAATATFTPHRTQLLSKDTSQEAEGDSCEPGGDGHGPTVP